MIGPPACSVSPLPVFLSFSVSHVLVNLGSVGTRSQTAEQKVENWSSLAKFELGKQSVRQEQCHFSTRLGAAMYKGLA
mgnify:CR=1 FL=1